ncbi:hypothetical protein CROQUDRAFT_136872 [Cronartium quercuum f. sp. fusiforme G11]|uniref:Uncharacterized protein n=1 Tax=Cronartium quercuum f. sp. fusiforme G11 TaxID=708437 RepID=A0A9P6T665_9BASI|nr:hypothetical protein CROQUDRAFT_136872 [Cronartium quercuum f. sp. fusiforme G11]
MSPRSGGNMRLCPNVWGAIPVTVEVVTAWLRDTKAFFAPSTSAGTGQEQHEFLNDKARYSLPSPANTLPLLVHHFHSLEAAPQIDSSPGCRLRYRTWLPVNAADRLLASSSVTTTLNLSQ